MAPRWTTADELDDLARDPDAAARLCPLAGGPSMLLVDLREGGPLGAAARELLAVVAIPTVAVVEAPIRATGAEAADVVVVTGPKGAGADGAGADEAGPDATGPDATGSFGVALDDTGLGALVAAVEATPLAAAALVLLLRGQSRRDVADGLVAESMTYSLLQAGPEFRDWRAANPPRPTAPTEDPVRLERDGAVLRLTLNRPGRHNAVDQATRDGLAHGLGLALADPGIAIVELVGEGPSFSSGGDLDEFGSFPDPATSHLSRLARSPARMAAALGPRLHVRLHGACMGAGIEVPAFAGRVLAAPDCLIALPEVRYGLVPGAGGTVSVTRRIGRHRTAWMALSGSVIGAPLALAWGLVDAIER